MSHRDLSKTSLCELPQVSVFCNIKQSQKQIFYKLSVWGCGFMLYWKFGQALYWPFIYSKCEAHSGTVWEGGGTILWLHLVSAMACLLCDSICLNSGMQQHLVFWSTSKIHPHTRYTVNNKYYLLHQCCIIFTIGTSYNNMLETAMQGSTPLPCEAQSRQFLYVQSTETSSYLAGLEPQQPRLSGCQVQSCRQKVFILNLGQDVS